MIAEFYDFIDSPDKLQYIFASEGKEKYIIKVVLFTHLRGDLWNMGFGDLKNGEIDDAVVSNNNDIVKVIGTIAKILYEFSDKYPTRRIEINPVDEKRKRLYHHIFRRNYDIIKLNFHVNGVFKNSDLEEDYSNKKNYDIFRLTRKFVP
jgi:hypothetical protein